MRPTDTPDGERMRQDVSFHSGSRATASGTLNGLVLIDKPQRLTSHDVVDRWRQLSGVRRSGHLGTLDPMATGLLMIVTGNATRLAPFFTHAKKTYDATIQFGATSDTYDADGTVLAHSPQCWPSRTQVEDALVQFRGSFLQMPPPISAKKVGGVPAYKLARKNKPVELKSVAVEVSDLELLMVDAEADSTVRSIDVRVCCSAGTYIRSIAHDLGRVLGCGGILQRLRRTNVGSFSVHDAWTLDQLATLRDKGELARAVLPSGHMLPEIPAERVEESVERDIRHGRQFRTSPFVVPPGSPVVRALSSAGELVAIGEICYPNVYQPKIVL